MRTVIRTIFPPKAVLIDKFIYPIRHWFWGKGQPKHRQRWCKTAKPLLLRALTALIASLTTYSSPLKLSLLTSQSSQLLIVIEGCCSLTICHCFHFKIKRNFEPHFSSWKFWVHRSIDFQVLTPTLNQSSLNYNYSTATLNTDPSLSLKTQKYASS